MMESMDLNSLLLNLFLYEVENIFKDGDSLTSSTSASLYDPSKRILDSLNDFFCLFRQLVILDITQS